MSDSIDVYSNIRPEYAVALLAVVVKKYCPDGVATISEELMRSTGTLDMTKAFGDNENTLTITVKDI